ncbi:hypothetical protein ACN47E_007360 [Coniothyrium glycines]
MPSNKALYADENATILVRNDITEHDLAANELLIEVNFSGVNPADVKHATGLGIRQTVLGYDFAGRVVKSSGSSQYKAGDLVAGYTPSSIGRPLKYGSHQDFVAAPEDMVFHVPSNLPESHAASLSVVAMTAADVVFNIFQAPLPSKPVENNGPLLIWSASTSVGSCVLQFAKASGFKNILVTASPGRHQLLRELGATHTFDYNSPTVIEDITSAVKELGKGPIQYAVDAVGTRGPQSSSDTMLKAVDKSTICSCVTRFDPPFKMPIATKNQDFRIQPLGAPHPIGIPANPESHWNAWEALKWAIANYGSGFKLPSVESVSATPEEAIEILKSVAEGKRGFGKVALKHPFN